MRRAKTTKPGLRVLGIDPGSRLCGYGVVDADGRYLASGTLVLSTGSPLHTRLRELHHGLSEVVAEFRPEEASVEKVFFARSVQSALTLGHARGVALLAVAMAGIPLHEYSPSEIKKAITGYGRADKAQMQAMVRRILHLDFTPSPDGADALAAALCHQQLAAHARSIA
jgi:crossover junction endodeoxyribonuclease RuvC